MKELNIILPYPPSVNRSWRVTKKGKMYLSKPVLHYRKEVWALTFGKEKFGDAKLKVEMKVFPPNNRRHDLDNRIKQTFDALQHANVFNDDYQVNQLTMEKCEVFEGGKIELSIREIL